MPQPVKGDVQRVLKDFHARIRKVVEHAWAEWRAMATFRAENGFDPYLYSRTIANIVFDAIARYAVAEFAANSAVHIEIEPQTIKLFFKSSVCARFKKGDENGLGQNIPTQAALAFEVADAMLPGFPPETSKVEFIWLTNDINTRLEHVLVVARDREALLWDYEIEETPSADTGTIIPFPEPPTPPAPPEGDDLVKPKKPEIKKPRENE